MSIADLFNKKGIRIPIESNKPLMLNNADSVWLVGPGKVSVFLTTLTRDNQPGAKTFLFEANQGEFLFGITPERTPDKRGLLASGLVGSSLIRLDISELKELLIGESSEEIIKLVEQWLNTLAVVSRGKATYPEGLASTEVAAVEERQPSGYEYLTNPMVRDNLHSQTLRSMIKLWEEQRQAEERRLQQKERNNQRFMANAVSKLASVNQGEERLRLQEASGNPLLDACRLVGRNIHIEIVEPPEYLHREQNELDLDVIARASRIRIREVALNGEWYKQDSGPILGFIEEDERPVALIPHSPAGYTLHDITLGTRQVVNQEIAAKIKHYGFIFYRPFENKVITVRDLLSFGYQSCWNRDLMLIVLMGVLGGLLGTAIPVATGIVFSTIIPEGERGQLLQIAFILGGFALANMLFQFTRSLATQRMEGKMDGSLQAAVWDRLISLPVPFFSQFSAGELVMRAMGINRIRQLLSGATLNTILSSIFSIFTFALLFYYDIKLAGIAALLVGIAVLIMGYFSYHKIGYEKKVLDASNKISGLMLQLIGGITKFRVAGAESRAFFRWAAEFGEQRQMVFARDTVGNLLTTFYAFFPVLSSLVIFYALTSSSTPLSPGQFIAFNSAFVSFMASMVSLSDCLISTSMIIPLYQRAKPILETLPEDDETKANPQTLTGSIEVNHVSFRYKEDAPLVLQDVSFQINEGDYVALVGASGCGKSTLYRILLGFEKPQTGNVYYNGQDLSKIDIRAVRSQLGVVLQNGQLMSGDILSNIIGANPRLTIEDAWEAARMAGIDEDINDMPMGMYTMICEGAGTISGGQKQRIMIARAIVNKPRIIYFDEATSALDNRTQAIVSKSLDGLQATRVVIAHRLSTIMNCNKIFVMDKGRIMESGSYQELMDRQGLFADLARRQLA